MIRHTNINILGGNKPFVYYFEYEDDGDATVTTSVKYEKNNRGLSLYASYNNSNETCVSKHGDSWEIIDMDTLPTLFEDINIKTSTVKMYIPEHSANIFDWFVKYAVTIGIWVGGKQVTLLNTIVDISNVLASDVKKTIHGREYYEYYPMSIINPNEILYSEQWREFREKLGSNRTLSEGSTLYITLSPVITLNDISYVPSRKYSGGQSFILLDEVGDCLKLNNNIIKYDDCFSVETKICLPSKYRGTIKQYCKDLYNVDIDEIAVDLVIKDEETGYRSITPKHIIGESTYIFPRDKRCSTALDQSTLFSFASWSGWKEGMFIQTGASFMNDGQEVFNLFSEKIPLTKKLFKFLVGNVSEGEPQYISLNDENITNDAMKLTVHNIDAINKIVQTVVKVDRPDDSKSNIIKPVFFKTQDLGNIIVHPAVTEHISLNLDSYKSKVSTFMIKLEGVYFNEIGRTQSGVIFKIVGNKLPSETKSGVYYITDTDGVMVTSGKYNYEE